ncbi:flagellar basal body-associated protein FliL [Escherichia coli]
MTDYAISKKSKRSLWIPILVFITLAACASAGYSYWHSHQVAADDKAQQRVVPSPVFYALDTFTVFYALDTFTVNLGDADRVLYIGITLRLKDEATRSRLSEYLPEVRIRLLLLFSRQDAAVLATEEGKKNLIAEIKTTLSTPLVAGQPKQDVTDVLYTAFILR